MRAEIERYSHRLRGLLIKYIQFVPCALQLWTCSFLSNKSILTSQNQSRPVYELKHKPCVFHHLRGGSAQLSIPLHQHVVSIVRLHTHLHRHSINYTVLRIAIQYAWDWRFRMFANTFWIYKAMQIHRNWQANQILPHIFKQTIWSFDKFSLSEQSRIRRRFHCIGHCSIIRHSKG